MSAHERTIRIDQALHGYSEGHRLLESSVRLLPKSARVLQVITDMSGPSMISGFESYLTGYPLAEMNAYALGRTWYAPEMTRPGCVWTHTLLVNNADLAQIADLSDLLGLFKHPTIGESWTRYKSPLQLNSFEESTNCRLASDLKHFAKSILSCLYETPDKPTYLEADSAHRHEAVVLALWSQQWPRLRRSFRFCTGALANRRTNEESFDLQVIPYSLSTSLRHEAPTASFIDLLSQDTSNHDAAALSPNSWVNAAAADASSKTQLRDFLWRFGADQSEERAAFKPLAEIYVCASNVKAGRASISKLFTLIGKRFPQPNQALRLKQSLFGAAETRKRLLYPEVSEKTILSDLVITASYFAFKPSTLAIRSRARNFYSAERDSAKELTLRVLAEGLTPLGEEFLTGVCETISIDDALALTKYKPNLLPLIIQHNPNLIIEPSIWKGPIDLQREIFDIVVKNNIGDGFLHDLIPVLLSIGVDTLAEEITSHIDSKTVVGAVLDWFDREPRADLQSIGTKWHRVVNSHPFVVLDWIVRKGAESEQRTSTMALAATILDPHDTSVIAAGADVWLRLAREGASELNGGTLINAMSFLLALGFNDPPPTGAPLVAKSFQVVHEAAMQESLSYSDWRLLQYQAPSVSFWRSWDKCERLRCALIERFIRFGWPGEYFLEAVSDTDTFKRTLECGADTTRGRKFLRRIARLVYEQGLAASKEQKTLLNKFTRSRRD